MTSNGTMDSIKQAAPKAVSKTGEITRPLLEKLGLAKPKASIFRRSRFYIAGGIIAAAAMVTKALFKPKSE